MVHIEKKEQPDLIFNSAAAFEMTEPPAVCVYAPSIASLFRLQPDNLTCQSAVRGVCGEILMHRYLFIYLYFWTPCWTSQPVYLPGSPDCESVRRYCWSSTSFSVVLADLWAITTSHRCLLCRQLRGWSGGQRAECLWAEAVWVNSLRGSSLFTSAVPVVVRSSRVSHANHRRCCRSYSFRCCTVVRECTSVQNTEPRHQNMSCNYA